MRQRVQCQPAYILHTRAFRDTSLLVDFFTRDFGKVRAVARGARTQRSKFRGLLQAFVPLEISWAGKSDLVTLSTVEPAGVPCDYNGDALLSALYLNELLERLLVAHDPHLDLFCAYYKALFELANPPHSIAASLRHFEISLLEELGFGFDWQSSADNHQSISCEQWYVFLPEQGFVNAGSVSGQHLVFPGAHVQAIANSDWSDVAVLRTAKQLLRAALKPLLRGKPIRSRELF